MIASSEAWLEQAGRGDANAFTSLYDRYASRILGLLVRMLGDKDVAEDLLQEVFFEIWTKASAFDAQRGSAEFWLFQLARRRAVDRLRQRGRRMRSESAPEPLDLTEPGGNAEQSEEQGRIRRAIGGLANDCRRPLELAFFQGLTYTEVAEHLGWPVGTVKTRIRTALQKLRITLDDDPSPKPQGGAS